jgi:3-oxoacyl-[acyl-carrier-protein] synthase II
MGMVTPLGDGVDTNWRRLMAAESGIRSIQAFDTSDLATKIAGEVPQGDKANGHFNVDDYLAPKEQRKLDKFIIFGIAAAQQAVEDSGWMPQDEEGLNRTGVMIGSGIGGLQTIYETSLILKERGPRRVSPFFIPSALINLASGQVSIKYGFKGPNHAVVTACATGAHAIGDAARLIQYGDADVMVAGGAEAAICRIGIAGFNACKALSTDFNDTPTQASRPWDKRPRRLRHGRGRRVSSCSRSTSTPRRAAPRSMPRSGLRPVGRRLSHHRSVRGRRRRPCAHEGGAEARQSRHRPRSTMSTPTAPRRWPTYDRAGRRRAHLRRARYGLSMSSTKSAIGHLLGAAGAIEAIFSQARDPRPSRRRRSISTIRSARLRHRSRSDKAKQRKIDALSNSFGFGGTNASLIFGVAGDFAPTWKTARASSAAPAFFRDRRGRLRQRRRAQGRRVRESRPAPPCTTSWNCWKAASPCLYSLTIPEGLTVDAGLPAHRRQ